MIGMVSIWLTMLPELTTVIKLKSAPCPELIRQPSLGVDIAGLTLVPASNKQ